MNPWIAPRRRRHLGILAIGALSACASSPEAMAQPGGMASDTVLPVPIPCADRPGDVVGLVLEGSGAPAGTVVIFGQAFRPGAVATDAQLEARQASGRSLPAQLDATTRHPDGSVRFGVVSIAAPALRPGEKLGLVLVARPPTPGPAPLNPAEMLTNRQAILEMLPTGGGEAWTADLVALLRTGLANRTARIWQSGSLASQARITVPVPPTAIGGATSMRLVADIAVRADGTLWVDAWLRNDIAMRPGGGPAAYNLRLLLDGREALHAAVAKHEHYTAWGRLLGTAPGGRPAPAPPLVRMDTAYLGQAGAVAHYDLSVGVKGELLVRLGQAVAAPAWAVPLGDRGVTRYMPMTGGRPDIGPTTLAQGAWLISGDPRAAAYAIGHAEAAGAIPWHFWDVGGGADGSGGWMDTRRWRGFWTDGRNGPPPRSLLQPPSREIWAVDSAHQPDLSYVPYLLTGRRALMDGLQAQAVASVLGTWPALRTDSDVVVVNRNQVRGAAWSLRQIDEAAWATPDTDSNADYLRQAAKGNWSWLLSKVPEWTSVQGEAYGWVEPGGYGQAGAMAPWQQDYFASTVIASASRGNEDALAFLKWQTHYLVGRFQQEAKGFTISDAVAYGTAVVDPASRIAMKTWAEIQAATVARRLANGDGWARGADVLGALMTLAGIDTLLGREEARHAYTRLLAAAGDLVRTEVFARAPNYNVVPRGISRLPARAARCVAP